MLNSEQIKTAIVDNEIDIFYSFYQKENGELALFEAEKSFLDSPYISNLYSDRLKLTMGPVVKVIDKQYFNPKRRFKNTDDCIDLRKTNNACGTIRRILIASINTAKASKECRQG